MPFCTGKLNLVRSEEYYLTKRIMVASPVRQKTEILAEFLASLDSLETTGLQLQFVFVDDHNEHDLLNRFAQERDNVNILLGSVDGTYFRDETTHYWREELIWKLATYKDRFIELARNGEYDYLFLVDSDLYLHPRILQHLVSLEKDIVAEVFWTQWHPNSPPLPQVWVADHYRLYEMERGEELTEEEIKNRTMKFLTMLSVPGTYKVGMLGACTLISRQALRRQISFQAISNLGLWGEDRHFCVRAAAFGLELYADTHYQPFHIYRESELAALREYKIRYDIIPGRCPAVLSSDIIADQIVVVPGDMGTLETVSDADLASSPPLVHQGSADAIRSGCTQSIPVTRSSTPVSGSQITLAMLVRNEAGRYLEKVLRHAAQFIDKAVILDDASEDNTVETCRQALAGIPLIMVSNNQPLFNNEIVLRKQLWELVISSDPDWILILDADEMFDDKASVVLRELSQRPNMFSYSFRLYDMWAEKAYREDPYWMAHNSYRPFMVKYMPGFNYVWRESPQHCGRFPQNIYELAGDISDLRLKHLGWMKAEDRIEKYIRYKRLDPNAVFGIAEQYESILDPNPNLIPWED